MIILKNLTEENYFLPEDRIDAKKKFLDTLALAEETYISCYAFTLQEAYDIILNLDKQGIKQSLLLDYSQGCGPSAKPKIKNLISNTKNTKIVLTAAGPKSDRPTSGLWHMKGLVKLPSDNRKAPCCMDGSTNMTISGFSQGNTMRYFKSKLWADTFIKQHLELRDWAINNLPHYQPSILADNYDSVDYFFSNFNIEENNNYLI